MNLLYDINDSPKFAQLILFALQQVLAIMAATIAVPAVVNAATGAQLSASAALCGAGLGTLVYCIITRHKSPMFLGSSFSFIPSMCAAFAGAATMPLGYAGLVLGGVIAGLVYCLLALIIKLCGTKWIDKVMPPVVIGPIVAVIGFSLAGSAVTNLQTSNLNGGSVYVCLICGLVALFASMIASAFGKRYGKIFPFIIGILAGYAVASIFYIIGVNTGNPALQIIDYSAFANCGFISLPKYTVVEGLNAFKDIDLSYFFVLLIAYAPVSFVVFAEHIADHKNLSSIIGHDLIEDPGLSRTLLGDGIGTMIGAAWGGAPNTSYGEAIACVGITQNASVITTIATATLCVILSHISPVMAFLETIPTCVMGGVCMALYGFISISGLRMTQNVDFSDRRNLFPASIIFMTGIGGLAITFGKITITAIAVALILGIIANSILNLKKEVIE